MDSVARGAASLGHRRGNEITGVRVNKLDWHELLMPDNLLGHVGAFDAHNSADVLQDAETVWDIFPEESSIQVEHHFGRVFRILGHHWERHACVAQVGVENPLEVRFVGDLTLVHSADTLLDGDNLRQTQLITKLLDQSGFDCLDLLIEPRDFLCGAIVKILIKFGHLGCFEGGLSIPVLEEVVDSAGVDDLVGGDESQVQEAGNWDHWDEVAVVDSVAHIMDVLQGE